MSDLLDDSTSSSTQLFRAVGQNEVQDILEFGGFRCRAGYGYVDGKWFATSFEDAVRWGRAFQRFLRPRPFRIVAMDVPTDFARTMEYHRYWDAIGPAYYVHERQLTTLNRVGLITVVETVFEPGDFR